MAGLQHTMEWEEDPANFIDVPTLLSLCAPAVAPQRHLCGPRVTAWIRASLGAAVQLPGSHCMPAAALACMPADRGLSAALQQGDRPCAQLEGSMRHRMQQG